MRMIAYAYDRVCVCGRVCRRMWSRMWSLNSFDSSDSLKDISAQLDPNKKENEYVKRLRPRKF